MKTRIALIGAGEFGNFATKVIDMLPDFELVAVADTREKAVLELAQKYNAKIYSDYSEMLDEKSLYDIVLINVPNHLHASIVCECLKNDKKVLCEKPLGTSKSDIEKVSTALKKSKGALLVNYLLPNSSIYQKIQKIVSSKKYGDLKYVSIENLATESTITAPWYWQREKSGGWFLTADIHFYHLLYLLTGQNPEAISSKEYFKDGKTCAIFTAVDFGSCQTTIFHDFTSSYKTADLRARFIFERADLTVKGWVPTTLMINHEGKIENIIEKENREVLYQKMVAKNLIKLTHINTSASLEHLEEIIQSSKIAFSAQLFSDIEQEERKKQWTSQKSGLRFSQPIRHENVELQPSPSLLSEPSTPST